MSCLRLFGVYLVRRCDRSRRTWHASHHGARNTVCAGSRTINHTRGECIAKFATLLTLRRLGLQLQHVCDFAAGPENAPDSSLRVLSLNEIPLRDDGCLRIVRAVRNVASLRELELRKNGAESSTVVEALRGIAGVQAHLSSSGRQE